jgi:hypothetical protein
VEHLRDDVTDTEVLLITENEEYNDELRTRVKFINAID